MRAIIVRNPVRFRCARGREIPHLAMPELGALAAEPPDVLPDTAVVGHLGPSPSVREGSPAQALWISLGIGFMLLAVDETAAAPPLHCLGAHSSRLPASSSARATRGT
jgi:hypothetical protein